MENFFNKKRTTTKRMMCATLMFYSVDLLEWFAGQHLLSSKNKNKTVH